MKSKQQKQAEAIERKKASIPGAIERLKAAAKAAREDPKVPFVADSAKRAEEALERLYREVGYSAAEAEGAARAVAAGLPPESWLSGPSTGVHRAVEASKAPACIRDAVKRTQEVVPGVKAVCLIPHPFLRAIQIRADGPNGDGSLVADMEILEMDRLGSAFRNEGVQVFRNEAAYMEYQMRNARAEAEQEASGADVGGR